MNKTATGDGHRHAGRWLWIAAMMLLPASVFLLAQDRNPGAPYLGARDFSVPARNVAVGGRMLDDRAFFGAPPPVPHSIRTERSSSDCLRCHALENRIAKRQRAISPVPHAEFSQCLQCHVPGHIKNVPRFKETEFVGLGFPGKGSRANDYSPPTIPHKTFMRKNCISCHGVTGDFSIKSPHPIRSQCRQCHAPEAAKDYTRPQ